MGEASRFPGTSHLAAVVDIPFLCSPGFESRTAFSVFLIKAGSVPLAGFMEKRKKNKTKKTTNLNAESKHPEMGRGEGTLKKIMKSSFPKTPEHEADTYLNNTHTILKEKDRWGNALKSHS